jgi:hypothetical protein
MPVTKKSGKEELVRKLFVALAPKWDIHDRAGAQHLAKQCLEMAEGYHDVMDAALGASPKKPEKPA